MKLTLVFPSPEARDLSIGVLFTPCLEWVDGPLSIAVPHPQTPGYMAGDLQKLLEMSQIRDRLSTHSKTVAVIVHSIGDCETPESLDLIIHDLEQLGFLPKLLEMG